MRALNLLLRFRFPIAGSLAPLVLGCLLLALPAASLPRTDARIFQPALKVALVIGNGSYQSVPALPNPPNDARAISEALSREGFEVILVQNASLARLREAVADFLRKAEQPEALALFYYAGHGLQLDWTNYLVPVDARLDSASQIPRESFDLNELLGRLRKAGTRMNIVILDACRDNPFKGASDLPRGLAQIDAPPRTLLAYATAPGATASDGAGDNGLYTSELLKQIHAGNARIEDLLKRVRYNVRAYSRGVQVPWESTSLEEDFFLGKPSEDSLAARLQAFPRELAEYQRVAGSKSVEEVRAFLSAYPSGNFSELAQYRLELLLRDEVERRRLEAEKTARQTLLAARSATLPPAKVAAEAGMQPVHRPDTLGTILTSDQYQLDEVFHLSQRDDFTGNTQTIRLRVTAIKDDYIEFNQGKLRFDRLGNPLRRQEPGIGTIDYTPHQIFAREYQMGKSWNVAWEQTINGDPNRKATFIGSARVAATEMVDTPLGPKKAYRLDLSGYLQDVQKLERSHWVVPGFKRPVKTTVILREPGTNRPLVMQTITLERVTLRTR